MSKMTLYLPEALEKPLKKRAKENRSSVSAWVVRLLEEHLRMGRKPQSYQAALDLFGTWKNIHIDLPTDPPLKPSDPLR